jgi:WD repeat-containing protein 19
LEWDRTGDVLAIMQSNSSVVVLWNLHTAKTQHLDTNVKDLTFMKWSKVGVQLALGTGKGTLILYDRVTDEKVVAQGRHKRRIVCGDWNHENKIAFASEDRQVGTLESKPPPMVDLHD